MKRFSKNVNEMQQAIRQAKEKGYAPFLSWFNRSGNVEESFIRGMWDFAYYFITPEVCRYINKPEHKKCLEIGYGGGRLLHASRSFFRHSYGIDIHPFVDFVKQKLLDRSPVDDFTLFKIENIELPLEAKSIDYVYSFIVIQHFYSIDILDSYLNEIRRVMKPNGLVNLFFGDLSKYPSKKGRLYIKSVITGYLEEKNPPNEKTANNTLWISKRWMRKRLIELGFKLISNAQSYKRIPDGYPHKKGSQAGILAQI